MKTLRILLLLLVASPAWSQYVSTPQAGVSYPALTNPTPIVLNAPGANEPKDKGRATIAIGFDFPFYNRVYSQVTVTANGVLFFEPSSGPNTSADFPGNVAIPNGSEPNGVIAPLWDDLFGSNQTSVVQRQPITGSNGQGLAIEYKDWSRWPSGFFLTFQVRLWQNGIIEFYYGQMTGMGPTPVTATIGIESPSGTAGTRALSTCNADCSLASFDPNSTGTLINFFRFSPPAGVDLQALSLRVDSIAATAGNLTIGTTFGLRNFGTANSGSFNYGVYLSEDTIYDPGIDLPLLPAPATPLSLGPLAVSSQTHSGSVAQPDGGSWYVIAAIPVLPDGGETNDFNNVVATSVPYAAGVDLIAESVSPPPVAGPGDVLSVDVRFSNQGFEAAGAVPVKLYASVDTDLTSDDRLLTSQTINVVGGQQVAQAINFTLALGTPADNYFVIMQLDDGPDAGVISERSELNNVVTAQQVMQVRQADLLVSQVRVMRAIPPLEEVSSVFFGEQARFEAFVSNVGGATAGNVRVSFHMSDNETLNAATDVFVGSLTGLTFAPGESRWVTLASATVPSQNNVGQPLAVQPYFFFAAAVGSGLVEDNNDNNFRSAAPVVGRLPAPNYRAIEMQAPLRSGAGEVIAVSRTLTNQGNRDGGPVKYRYYLSANTIITADDYVLPRVTSTGDVVDGTVTLAIDQRDSLTELLRMPASLAAATYYVGVLIDPDDEVLEADEDDNGLASIRTEIVPQSLGLSGALLPDGTIGLPYSVQLTGTGAPGPFSFAIAQGATLPAGLTLSSEGILSGTPTAPGAYTLIVEVTAGGRSVIASVALRIAHATGSLMISALPLPAPTRLVRYTARIGASGGAGEYRFQIVDGVLPVGLVMNDFGELSGIPDDPLGTTRSFVVRCFDLIGNIDERAFSMTVVDAAPFSIVTRLLPGGAVGAEYLQLVVSANPSGAPVSTPVAWRLIGGTLPPGLALEPSVTDTIALSGTPTRPGLYEFTIEATDAQGRIDAYSYVVPIVSGAITARGEGTRYVRPGGAVSVTFSAEPLPAGAKWFWREGQLPPGVTFNEDGTLSGTVPADAPTALHTMSLSVGLTANEPLAVVWWTVEVNPEAETSTGCSAVGGELLAFGAMLWLARRRRVTGRSQRG